MDGTSEIRIENNKFKDLSKPKKKTNGRTNQWKNEWMNEWHTNTIKREKLEFVMEQHFGCW